VMTLLVLFFLAITVVGAEAACDLDVSLIRQDPYPAVPGGYAKLVFQVEGVNDVDCSDITFELIEDYPIEFDPSDSGIRRFDRVNYLKDSGSNILVPFDVRIDEDALDGSNEVEVRVQSWSDAPLLKTFDVEVNDVLADFEVYVKDYRYDTKELTLEILNIEESDIEALTVEIPQQENIIIKGANRVVVGDLDSNEYTTADFEATPSDGEIVMKLTYSDSINVRRSIDKSITFSSEYFTDRVGDSNGTSIWTYIIWIIVILVIIYWWRKRSAKKKKR